MIKQKIFGLIALSAVPLLLAGCGQKKQTKSQALASEALKKSQSKASSYSKFVSVQATKPKIDMTNFRNLYSDLKEDNDGMRSKNSGRIKDVLNAQFNLQDLMKNKYVSQDRIKNAYSDSLTAVDSAVKDINGQIATLKQFRQNTILDEAIVYYQMENHLLKMEKIYLKSIYKQDDNLDNSAAIELYKDKINTQFNKIAKKMIPIIQQANYEENSANYHSNRESQYENKLSDHFSSRDDLSSSKPSGSASDEIANDGKGKAANDLDKYNTQIPNDK